MDQSLFDQLRFVRGQTLKLMAGVTEEQADVIPDGFRNSIRWNLGHIYVVLERFAFHYVGLPLHLPKGIKERFETGSSPLTADVSTPAPTLPELERLLIEQLDRVQESLGTRLNVDVVPPYTTSAGMKLATIGEFLSFNLYHEGMHIGTIKSYKKLTGS
ncbi:DinB family protein [Cohnella luojiensis]|uniref:DinB family protein n=1 Tax=Cohnella luojiensis TaxID=652876 RepID=A0A4Y8LVC7_9BACL|nr:DinB family protein [Cohnella luojiensis]TFE25592.1 DinB family protein [Cohnella luojiensis]